MPRQKKIVTSSLLNRKIRVVDQIIGFEKKGESIDHEQTK